MSSSKSVFHYGSGNHQRVTRVNSLYEDVEKDLVDIAKGLEDDVHEHQNEEKRWSLTSLREEFKSTDAESLFHKYQARLQIRLFAVALALNIITNTMDIIFYFIQAQKEGVFATAAIFHISAVIVYVSFLTLTWNGEQWFHPKISRTLAALTVLTAMLFAEYAGVLILISGDYNTMKFRRIRPVYYLIITNEILLPYNKRLHASLATLFIIAVEISFLFAVPKGHINICSPSGENLYKSIAVDLFFYILTALIAFYVTFILEIINRRAFLDHRRSVESKFKLNFEKEQQEQLLNSCLPKHLSDRVRQDFLQRFLTIRRPSKRLSIAGLQSSLVTSPYEKAELYIEKHPLVSILYADIVNSMSLAQSLTPKELVETLNELFERFDARAEAHNCLRIKLLGDCYYCVSGIPYYDENHAINCIKMGLDMIDIIRSVRENMQVDVDMRIGVHSGMVLSGLIGMRKWQYDIWSIDAMKASSMEHEGKPGHVHITRNTYDLIPFEEREKLIIDENLHNDEEVTYFVTKPNYSKRNSVFKYTRRQNRRERLERFMGKSRTPALKGRSFRIESLHLNRRRTMLEETLKKYHEMIDFVNEYMDRSIDKMPLNIRKQWADPESSINPIFLYFVRDKKVKNMPIQKPMYKTAWDWEREYTKESDPLFHYYLLCCGLLWIASVVIRLVYLPIYVYYFIGYATSFFIILFSLILSYYKKKRLNYLSRILIWFFISSSLMASAIMDLINCTGKDDPSSVYDPRDTIEKIWRDDNPNKDCLYKWTRYYTFISLLALTSASMFVRINLWLKIILQSVDIVAVYLVTNLAIFINGRQCSVFVRIDSLPEYKNYSYPQLNHLANLLVVYLMFHLIDRQIEYILRLDFHWKTKIEDERQEVKITREINQLLLKNILPAHVALRYLNNTVTSTEQLYCEHYETCAVMFASIPNFSEFYSENAMNDYGLNCLKVLNDIIIEFDKLLSHDRFFGKIEKIKTIGSTYMAAAGLQPGGRGSFDDLLDAEQISDKYGNDKDEEDNKKGFWKRTSSETMRIFHDLINLTKRGSKSDILNESIEEQSEDGNSMQLEMEMEEKDDDEEEEMKKERIKEVENEKKRIAMVVTLIEFAFAMMHQLQFINKWGFQEFKLRIGIDVGEVIAGVVGAVKPQYDIWGDTVNVASRMDSNGVCGRIHVTEEIAQMLMQCEDVYELESRGRIPIKGKGYLTTYTIPCPENISDIIDL